MTTPQTLPELEKAWREAAKHHEVQAKLGCHDSNNINWHQGRDEGLTEAADQLAAFMARGDDETERLRSLCACAYQMAGFHDASVEWLDALSDAANGIPLDDWRVKGDLIETLLPYTHHSQQAGEAVAWRLLEEGDVIQAGDQFVTDDANDWDEVGPDHGSLCIGMAWRPRVFKIGRRRIAPAAGGMVGSEDAKDAARYRWLREPRDASPGTNLRDAWLNGPEALDAEIDNAIAAAPPPMVGADQPAT